ncbi:Rieske (2Fe-2S) protein [Nocardioides sp. MAHUQ-72]|uniref:Rieske (2Fe-2S) protein n=1 Tax=unclassified Nocardioides TaxID=2615069 RepID=UPI00360EE2EE
MTEGLTRRHALTGAATVGLGLPLLAACGGGGGSATDPGSSAPAGTDLGPAADIPVGGGAVFADQKVVVTQPAKGEFKAFSAVCTHQGCTVAEVKDGTINCPCHNSHFSIQDGAVESGPAPSPLPAVKVTVKGGEIRLA